MLNIIKKILIAITIISTMVVAQDYNPQELDSLQLTQKAVIKLIDENTELEERLNWLEEQVSLLTKEKDAHSKNTAIVELKRYKEVILEVPKFFIPSGKSFIREFPNPSATSVKTAYKNKRYKINKIACYRNIGFWGKSDSGWIFISNARYGKLVDMNNDKALSLDYENWCK